MGKSVLHATNMSTAIFPLFPFPLPVASTAIQKKKNIYICKIADVRTKYFLPDLHLPRDRALSAAVDNHLIVVDLAVNVVLYWGPPNSAAFARWPLKKKDKHGLLR